MRVLLDNCVDRKFGALLPGHEVVHASRAGWPLLENGDLISAAEAAGYEVMITVDKNLRYQQNLMGRRISIVTLAPRFVFFRHIEPLAPRVIELLTDLPAGSFVRSPPRKNESAPPPMLSRESITIASAESAYNSVMRSLQIELPDGVYAEAQRAADAGGFPDMAAYVSSLITQDTENLEHLFTSERLAIIDRADAAAAAGDLLTMDQVQKRLTESKKVWLQANPH